MQHIARENHAPNQPTEEQKQFVKRNLEEELKKLYHKMAENENFLALTPNISLKGIVETSEYQQRLGQAYQLISSILRARFPEPHQQSLPLKEGLVIPKGLEEE